MVSFSLRFMPKVIYIRFGSSSFKRAFNSELTKVSLLLYSRILRNTWGIITENLLEGEKKRLEFPILAYKYVYSWYRKTKMWTVLKYTDKMRRNLLQGSSSSDYILHTFVITNYWAVAKNDFRSKLQKIVKSNSKQGSFLETSTHQYTIMFLVEQQHQSNF